MTLLAAAVSLVLAGCADDIREANSGASSTPAAATPSTSSLAASPTASTPTAVASATPDPAAATESVTEQSELGVALGELPLPAGTRPMGAARAEGATVSQVFEVQGLTAAADVLDADYLDDLEADGWEVIEPVADRGDGVAATLQRDDLELLLVAQDGPNDDATSAVLNILLQDREA